jgi:nucleoside-diphosphate-sugar epimerase
MRYTVLGPTGFIGRALMLSLRAAGEECFGPERDDEAVFSEELGHVFYTIGLTADWRGRPHETVLAHVEVLRQVLARARFSSLLYLSSTRVYRDASSTREDSALLVRPTEADDLFNISKLLGESLCLSSPLSTVRVARLSNVYGPDFGSRNFLPSIVADAVERGNVTLQTSLESEKDFVSLADVVHALPAIAARGRARVYNVAAGRNTTNEAIVRRIADLTGCTWDVVPGSPRYAFPRIDTDRLRTELGFAGSSVLDDLPEMIRTFREASRGEVSQPRGEPR